MKYTKEDFPENFVITARTQEEAIVMNEFFQKLGYGIVGTKDSGHNWDLMKEDTVYYFGAATMYGSYEYHKTSSYVKTYELFESLSDLLKIVTYEIY